MHGSRSFEDDEAFATAHVPWEVKLLGGSRAKFVETNVLYAGERPSALGFFSQFKDIIFRMEGSVLGFIVIESERAARLELGAAASLPL